MADKDFNAKAREFNGFVIPQRKDGFLDATAMAKACDKTLENWWRNKDVLALFNALAEQEAQARNSKFNPVILQDSELARLSAIKYTKSFPNLIEVKRGSPKFGGGTWLHPMLSIQLAQWLNPVFALSVSKWAIELLTAGTTSTSDFDSNLGASLGKRLRIRKKPCPWDKLYEKEMCDKIKKWYGFDSSKFYWWYVYNFLTSEERALLETRNPVLKVVSKNGKERTARKYKIHQYLDETTRERLTDFAEYLWKCIEFCDSKIEFEKKWSIKYGLPTQLEIFDLWEFAS